MLLYCVRKGNFFFKPIKLVQIIYHLFGRYILMRIGPEL